MHSTAVRIAAWTGRALPPYGERKRRRITAAILGFGVSCSRCGGLVTAFFTRQQGYVDEIFPGVGALDDAIPNPSRSYLQQAIDSLHSPAGAVMLAASAVDAMLKAKGIKTALYTYASTTKRGQERMALK